MTTSLMKDAFGHHVWATVVLIDACSTLTPERLATSVPGTYGSIIDTMRHTVGADCSYLVALTGGQVRTIEEEGMDLAGLRAAMVANGPAWDALLATSPDPEVIVVRHRDDGSESSAPAGIRLAQALHHGTDHRSQICTALTSLGIEPPSIDAWDFAQLDGRLSETPATS